MPKKIKPLTRRERKVPEHKIQTSWQLDWLEDVEFENGLDIDEFPETSTEQDAVELCEILNFLNLEDRDVFLLYFVRQKIQSEVGEMVGIGQAAVYHKLNEIGKKLQFILWLRNEAIPKYIDFLASKPQLEPKKIAGLTAYLYSTSHTQAAKICGLKANSLRYQIIEAIKILEEEYPEIHKIFKKIDENQNALRRFGYKKRGRNKKK